MESTEVLRGELREQIDGEIDNARHSAPDRSARTGERIDIRSVAPDDGRYVTLEEYWARWYENPYPDIDASYEWNNGRLEAKPLSNRRQLDLYKWFLLILHCNVKRFDHAALINLETGFVLTIADPAEPSGERVQVRKPDIGVILNSNPVSWGGIDQRHFAGVCDLVVESLSDSSLAEVRRDTEEKKRDYAEAQRADSEAQRADTEAQRANREAQRADTEAVARQQAEERSQALEAELARLRQRLS